MNLHVNLDVRLSGESFIAEIAGEAFVVLVESSLMVDELRPFSEHFPAAFTLPLQLLVLMSRDMDREGVAAEETFVALTASERMLLLVLLNLVLS